MANTTINAGKVNFNVKTAKNFRNTMALWHVYEFELKDRMKKRSNDVARYKGIIADDQKHIDEKSFNIHDELWYRSDIVAMEARIKDAQTELDNWISGQEESRKNAEILFTKNLYKAYVASLAEDQNAWRVSPYTEAIANLLAGVGLTPAWDTLDKLYRCVADDYGNGSSMAETGKHTKAFSENKWRHIFMGKLCDFMGDLLPTYKFVNILTKAEKKALRDQKKNQ